MSAGGTELPAVLAAQTRLVCRPPDKVTTEVIQDLQRELKAPDAISQQRRESAHLPQGAAVRMDVVTDENVCRKAREAYVADTRSYDRNTGQWNTPATRVYVLQVDTLYYVWDPGTTMGEFQLVSTLDAHFNSLVSLMR
jgi:hypothetical protein